MRIWLAWFLLFGGGGDEFAAGVRAYDEGRFADALTAFTAAEQAAGHGASAELVYDRGLAALRTGELRVAEFSAEKAAARGGPGFAPLCDFLLGNAAFARSLRARAEAGLQEADPTAFDRAIGHATLALEFWRRAAVSRDDWPSARRNVERALAELDELRAARDEAEKNRQAHKERSPEQQPEPPRDPLAATTDAEQDPTPQAEPGDLSRERLLGLFARLDEKEREKRALRSARRQARSIRVEKDW